MSDALISPQVGGALWAISAGLLAVSARKLRKEADDSKTPLMAVAGAFVFAAQMINFAIPGTGSSGHLGGGLLLAVLLGPSAAFLTIACVLMIQALLFADGGLLALGCNIFNMGFFPAFIAYPFIYRGLTASSLSQQRIFWGSLAAAVTGLQLGAVGVVLQTVASGISAIDTGRFLLFMQPIHLAIGIVEGLATAGLLVMLQRNRPGLLAANARPARSRKAVLTLAALTLAVAGVVSWFASENPDGLEWALEKTETAGTMTASGIHGLLGRVRTGTARLPDYSFKSDNHGNGDAVSSASTSTAGLIGSAVTLLAAGLIGYGLRRFGRNSRTPGPGQ